MTVLHVISGLAQGGAESALFRLVTCRQAGVVHVVVSLMDVGVYGQPLRDAGVEVHTLGMGAGRMRFSGFRQLWRLIRRVRPDAVQTWMYHADLVGGLAARLAGYANVTWGIVNFDVGPDVMSRKTKAVVRLSALLSRLLPRQIVSCSSAAVPVHVRLGYARSKFRVIHLGFADAPAQGTVGRDEVRRIYGVGAHEFLLGCVARWDPVKDHVTLLKALAIVNRDQPVRCLLVGNRMTGENQALAAQLDDTSTRARVVLAGRVEDLPAAMRALDVHVLASRGEAFPNVLAEAMLLGIPCIATDVGDVRLILGDTGWVVPPGEPAALAAAIGEAVRAKSDAARWQARQEACRSRVREQFSLDAMVSAYHEIWSDALQAG